VLIFVLGTILKRSAGCAINDWGDRLRRLRRAPRVVPSPQARSSMGGTRGGCGAGTLRLPVVLATNRTTILLSFPAVAIAVVYPFFKRFFVLPGVPRHCVLVRHSDGVRRRPRHRAADRVVAPYPQSLLGRRYDTEYAMVDRDDDILGPQHARDRLRTLRRERGVLLRRLPRRNGGGRDPTRDGLLYYAGLAVALGCALFH
jgi:4-hydroxybenzoate polyprenyltransferase